MTIAESNLTDHLRLLADPTRLRILALVDAEELSVGELSRSLGLAQSRVSNHLRHLREAGLLTERHAGSSTYLRRREDQGIPGKLWKTLRSELESQPEHAADRVRLRAVLAEREGGEFFDRIAGQWDKRSGGFESGQGRQRCAAQLLPAHFALADLGCGTGYFAESMVGLTSRLVCIDQSQGMLDQARERLQPLAGNCRLEFKRGKLDELPLATGELDGVVSGMVLHHLPSLVAPLEEMSRVLRPGGTAVVVELAPHNESWMRAELGDRHLGLNPSDVMRAFTRAGFVDVVLDPLADRYRPQHPAGKSVALELYAVRGRLPLAAAHSPSAANSTSNSASRSGRETN